MSSHHHVRAAALPSLHPHPPLPLWSRPPSRTLRGQVGGPPDWQAARSSFVFNKGNPQAPCVSRRWIVMSLVESSQIKKITS